MVGYEDRWSGNERASERCPECGSGYRSYSGYGSEQRSRDSAGRFASEGRSSESRDRSGRSWSDESDRDWNSRQRESERGYGRSGSAYGGSSYGGSYESDRDRSSTEWRSREPYERGGNGPGYGRTDSGFGSGRNEYGSSGRGEYGSSYGSGRSDYGANYGRSDYGFGSGRSGSYGGEWRSQNQTPSFDTSSWGGAIDRDFGGGTGWRDQSSRGSASMNSPRSNREGSGLFRGKGPKGYKRSDSTIQEEVCDRLTDDPSLDASSIECTVKNGEVTLSGTVTSREDKRRAEDIASAAMGVSDVENKIRVQSSTGSESSSSNQGSAHRDVANAVTGSSSMAGSPGVGSQLGSQLGGKTR